MQPTSSGAGAGGGIGGTATGRRVTVSVARLTFFDWFEAKVMPIRAVTPGDSDASAAKPLTPVEHVRHCLGMDEAAAAGDARPTLVYFHWPHEDPVVGKATETLCKKVLDDEGAARWGLLYRCVQVDMSASDPRLVALLGAGDKPALVVVDAEAAVVARIPAPAGSDRLQKALEAALSKCPAAAAKLKDALASQERSLEAAHDAAKAGHLDEAKSLVDGVRMSQVRVGPAFDRAMREGADLDARIEREKAKSAR